MTKTTLFLERKLAAFFFRLLRKSLRFTVTGQPEDGFPCIYVFWHRDLLLMTIQRINSGAAVLVSRSQDGELIAGPIGELGYKLVRGSSSRGGSEAIREMVRLGRENSLAVTPDGPKGPPGTIHPGIFQIAWLAGIPIIPTVPDCDKTWTFRTWDRLRLPKPFARIRIEYKAPISVAGKDGFAQAEELLREALAEPVAATKE